MPIINKTEAEAQSAVDAINAFYVAEGLDGTLTATIGQSNKYFDCTIPTARKGEFDAADAEKQNNFFLFSIAAELQQDDVNDFVTIWESEYSKVYP